MRFNFKKSGQVLVICGIFQSILAAGAGAWDSVAIQLGFVGLGLIFQIDRKFLSNLVA